MSRCFPFPPPGYEKKIKSEEADTLIKEKQKKHKKEKKKDKEKRQGKEKKDKETSKDRYKEGKERKEKPRDRKDKVKSRTSQQDIKAVGVLPNTLRNNGNEESKFIQDLVRRINNEEEARESSFPCGVTEIFAMEKRSESAVLQETNHLRENVTKGDKSMDKEEIKKSEPKYTTHRSSQEKTEAINKSKPKYTEGGSILKERDVDTRNIGKRKNHETNGFSYENGSRLNKIQKLVASPVSSVENGSKLGACQSPLKPPVTELQGTVCNPEHRINGFIDAQEHKRHPAISSVKLKENGEELAKKRPHSDLKYLDQLLNVPKWEELHEFDESEEQEWLFGQSGMKLSKKPKTDCNTSLDETLQVWNQALRIESADTVALPYVVPF